MPTLAQQLPNGPDALARRVAALERALRELRAATPLQYASIGAVALSSTDSGLKIDGSLTVTGDVTVEGQTATGPETGIIQVTAHPYNAACDGTTDDTAAIQQALDDAGSGGWGSPARTVQLPARFILTRPLTIPHGVTLRGAGMRATTLIAASGLPDGSALLSSAVGARMVTVADLRLLGASSSQGTAKVSGILLDGSGVGTEYSDMRSQIHHVHVEDFTGDGITLTSAAVCQLTGCTVFLVGGSGFVVGNGSEITACDAGNAGADGFLVQGNSVVANCRAWYCGWNGSTSTVTSSAATTGNGFHITAADGGALAGCYAQDCGRSGFYFDGASGLAASHLVADSNNNNASGTAFAGIDFDNHAGPLIASCHSFDRGANTQHQAAAARLNGSAAPSGVRLDLSWTSNASMTALWSSDTTTAVLKANQVSAVNSSGSGQAVYGPQAFYGGVTVDSMAVTNDWELGPNWVSAGAYNAVGNYSTDDTAALQRAVDALSAAGGGTLVIGQHVVTGAGIVPKSNVTIAGIPGYSKLKNTSSNPAISSSVACSNIGFRDFTIEGPVTSTVTVPTRARTTSGPGTTTGIWLDGSLDTTVTGAPAITDVTIRNVRVENCTSLPIRIFGVGGRVVVEGCSFYNCMDAGFGFNAEVICANNHSLMSADNGFSISRGNQKITCTGNTVELAAYHGIWLSGYTGSAGPSTFACTGNTVLNVGECGILLQDAPKYGTVSGNTINKGYFRGESGAPTDDYVYGILVRGSSSTPASPGTSIAYGLKVTGNTVVGAPKAGIGYDGATSVAITDNLILDCGTEYLADGTTAITSSYTSQNVGILCPNTGTATASIVRNNDVIDQRATPYCNWGLYPVHTAGVTAVGNTMTGCRNSSNLPAALSTYTAGYMDSGQETLKRTEINASSITMVSGILRLAYFVARRNATVTALKAWSGSTPAGATPSLVQFGLYAVSSTGDLTLLSSTANDTSVFGSASTAYQRNLGAAQALEADQTYAIGVLVVTSATAPTVLGNNVVPGADAQLSPVMSNNLTGQTGLPASITAASLSATASVVYGIAVGA